MTIALQFLTRRPRRWYVLQKLPPTVGSGSNRLRNRQVNWWHFPSTSCIFEFKLPWSLIILCDVDDLKTYASDSCFSEQPMVGHIDNSIRPIADEEIQW